MCIENPSAAEVIEALEALVDIKRPYGENEGGAINSDTIFPYLSEEEQNLVEAAEELAITYTRRPVDRPDCDADVDRGAINELRRAGFDTHLNASQEDPYRLVGYIQVADWKLDISDPKIPNDNDA